MEKLKIAILFGGVSSERDVSIASCAQIVNALRFLGHDANVFDIASGFIAECDESAILDSKIPLDKDSMLPTNTDAVSLTKFQEIVGYDLAFLALHGGTGENGMVQSILELLKVPYTGSNVVGSAVAMNKAISKELFLNAGVKTPQWIMWPEDPAIIEEKIGYPLVVKPNSQGSTVGLTLVHGLKELIPAVENALKYDAEVMIESFIEGRELTVGVLKENALAVGEILVEQDAVFGYQEKYREKAIVEIFPANLPLDIQNEVCSAAIAAHKALRLRDYSRIDFRLDRTGVLWCLEANSLPGMTSLSLFPQSAKIHGYSFPEICQILCEMALERK